MDVSVPSRSSQVHRTTVGRYELCAELASGGMGRVYLARAQSSQGFDKLVALKCIHPELATEKRFVDMFLDEARIAARIVHPNVCSVFEFGESDGRYFLAMEYLEGESVSRLVRAMARASERSPDHDVLVAWIVAQAAEGLHAAHTLLDDAGHPLEVVHRDVSPHNLFVTYDGGVRVVDFGIASARGRLHETTTGSVKGKFAYMPPEQMRREKVDRRADVWSLGVVLWELLTLERMRTEDSEVDLILAVLNEPVRPPSAVRAIDPALEAIVMGALDRSLATRTATARELSQALRRWIVGRGAVVGMPEIAALMERAFPEGRAQRRRLLDAARRGEVTAELLPAATPSAPLEVEVETVAPAHRASTTDRRAPGRSRAGWAIGGAALVALAALGWRATSGDGSPNAAGAVTSPASAGASGAAADTTTGAGPTGAGPTGAGPTGEVTAESSSAANLPALEPSVLVATAPGTTSTDAAPVEPTPGEERDRTARAVPRVTHGRVHIETPGGWAEVVIDGERRGRTPLTLELPAGRHAVQLRPFGLTPPADDASLRRTITIGARDARVVLRLDE